MKEIGDEYDPWEPMNTNIFEFNRQLDRFVLKPVAKGYNFVMPDLVQVGISNIFYNLRFAPRFFNNVFQGKVKGAGIEVGRFVINSTVGVAGFFDIAKQSILSHRKKTWGRLLDSMASSQVPISCYRSFSPSPFEISSDMSGICFSIRSIGLVVPIIEVEGVPSVIAHKNRTTTSIIQTGSRVGEIVNERSRNLENSRESRKRRWIFTPPSAMLICRSALRRFGSRTKAVCLVVSSIWSIWFLNRATR